MILIYFDLETFQTEGEWTASLLECWSVHIVVFG